MTNKELELIVQLTEVAITVAELKAENKILKDVNEKMMKALRIHDVVRQSEQLVCRICGTNEEMSKDYDLCYVCWKEYHPDAN